jgi:SAM-dependent methyltransferase
LFGVLHAVGETRGDEAEARLFQSFQGSRQLCDDVAALTALFEHALHSLDLAGDSAEPLSNVVDDLIGKLQCSLLSSEPRSGLTPLMGCIPYRVSQERREDRVNREDWNERYGIEELVWRAEPNQFLVQELDSLEPGRALDVACGEGRNAVWLAAKGWTVTGVDFSAAGLAKARRMATDRGLEVEWVEADVIEWQPAAASFDLVVVMYLHLPGADRRRVLAHVTDALAPGATLLVVGHDSSNLAEGTGGPQDPAVLYGPEEIVGDLPGLQILQATRVTRTVASDAGESTAIDALVRAICPY